MKSRGIQPGNRERVFSSAKFRVGLQDFLCEKKALHAQSDFFFSFNAGLNASNGKNISIARAQQNPRQPAIHTRVSVPHRSSQTFRHQTRPDLARPGNCCAHLTGRVTFAHGLLYPPLSPNIKRDQLNNPSFSVLDWSDRATPRKNIIQLKCTSSHPRTRFPIGG